jgi:flotillin
MVLKKSFAIYNSNVKQLVDVPGHEYFSYLGQKTQQGAASQARVDVAEARMKRAVGEKEREGLTKQNAAKGAGVRERQGGRHCGGQGRPRHEEGRVEQAGQGGRGGGRQGHRPSRGRAADGGRGQERALPDREAQGREQLSKATVQYDMQVQDSNALFYSRQKAAEATLYEETKAAEARKAQADARFFEQRMAEDARLYAKQREAEAVALLGKAKAEYAASMLAALGGNYNALRDYLMIDGGVYAEMARINAGAVSGMQPKISIWSNGSNDGAGGGETGGAMQQVAGVYKMLPPLLSTVHEQNRDAAPGVVGRSGQGRHRRQLILIIVSHKSQSN